VGDQARKNPNNVNGELGSLNKRPRLDQGVKTRDQKRRRSGLIKSPDSEASFVLEKKNRRLLVFFFRGASIAGGETTKKDGESSKGKERKWENPTESLLDRGKA